MTPIVSKPSHIACLTPWFSCLVLSAIASSPTYRGEKEPTSVLEAGSLLNEKGKKTGR
jgi:hypothetical protein